jgi:hypothetical protein
MFHRFLCIALLCALVLSPCWAAGPDKKELKKFDGTWTIIKMEINGRSLLEKD